MPLNIDLIQSLIDKNNNILDIEDMIIPTERIDYIVSKIFRPYQLDMWREFKNTFNKVDEQAWQFWASTGSGKTEIFKFIFPYMISKHKEEGNNTGLVFGIVCHRLCLIKDLKNRIFPIMFFEPDFNNTLRYVTKNNFAGCGINKNKIKFYIVNSANYNTTSIVNIDLQNDINSINSICSSNLNNLLKDAKYIKNMTNDELKNEIDNNRKNNIHSMFICLYQSVAKYETKLSPLNFDFIICDEIHALNSMGADIFKNCINFFKNVKRRYNFTASPQIHPDDIENQKLNEFIQYSVN